MVSIQKRNNSLEKEINNSKSYFENLISQYKTKIDSLMAFNDSSIQKIKDLEKTLQAIQEINSNIDLQKKKLEEEFKAISEEYESEKGEKAYYQSRFEEVSDKLNTLTNMVRNLEMDRVAVKQSQGFLFERLEYFYNNY